RRINGRAVQTNIHIKLRSLFSQTADAGLKIGTPYELRGYEEGGYVGTPDGVFKEVGPFQTTGFYFQNVFVTIKSKQIPPIAFGPADFLDRFAVLEGKARTEGGRGFLVGADWKLLVLPQAGWPGHMEGKLAEAEGVLRALDQSRKNYRLEG